MLSAIDRHTVHQVIEAFLLKSLLLTEWICYCLGLGVFQCVAAFKLLISKNIVNSPYSPKSLEVFCFKYAKVLLAKHLF